MRPQGDSEGFAQWLGFGLWCQSVWVWLPAPSPQSNMVLDKWLHLSTSEKQIMIVSASYGFCEQKITCVCIVLDDFELSNYYLSSSSLWLLRSLPEGTLLLVSVNPGFKPASGSLRSWYSLVRALHCWLHFAHLSLKKGPQNYLSWESVHLSINITIRSFPHSFFLSSCIYQIGKRWPNLCKYWGIKQTNRKRNKKMNQPELSLWGILGTELGILSPSFHLIILEKQILYFPFYTWANSLWQTIKQNNWSHVGC